jgi:hypothetical protein
MQSCEIAVSQTRKAKGRKGKKAKRERVKSEENRSSSPFPHLPVSPFSLILLIADG